MKAFIISLSALLSVLLIWGVFSLSAMSDFQRCMDIMDGRVLQELQEEKWSEAQKDADDAISLLDGFRVRANYLLNADDINELRRDEAMVKVGLLSRNSVLARAAVERLLIDMDIFRKNQGISIDNIL